MKHLIFLGSDFKSKRSHSLNHLMGFYLLSPWMKIHGVTIQIKATEQYFPVVLFILLYKVILTFEPVNEILKCNH